MTGTRQVIKFILCSLLLVGSGAQQYDDYQDQGYEGEYGQDSLYHDYAIKQQEKEVGPAGIAWGKILIGTGVGWLAGGTYHTKKKEKKLNAKHKEEQKQLYTQYYNDVYSLQQQNAELAQVLEQYAGRGR